MDMKVIPISDTNSTLFITYIGNFTEDEKNRILITVAKEIPHQAIYFNDLECRHWSFDYESECGYWVENIKYTDFSLRKVECTVCDCTRH